MLYKQPLKARGRYIFQELQCVTDFLECRGLGTVNRNQAIDVQSYRFGGVDCCEYCVGISLVGGSLLDGFDLPVIFQVDLGGVAIDFGLAEKCGGRTDLFEGGGTDIYQVKTFGKQDAVLYFGL